MLPTSIDRGTFVHNSFKTLQMLLPRSENGFDMILNLIMSLFSEYAFKPCADPEGGGEGLGSGPLRKSRHHRPISETPLKWCCAGGSIVARYVY